MRRRHALAILAVIAAAPAAHAEPAAGPEPATRAEPAARTDEIAPRSRPAPSALRRLAAIGAAIVPGIVVHGAGSYVLGERRTAKRLLEVEGVGVAAAALGGAAVGGSGASPYFIAPGAPAAVAGGGLFAQSWLADLWVAAGGERVRGGPRAAPPWSIELSTTGVRDPFRKRALTGAAGTVELGRLGLGASARLDVQGESRDGAVEARWRIIGAPAGGGPIEEGSRLYVRTAARYHRDDADDVALATAELEAVLRAELRRIDPLLAGMFLELSTGAGLERAAYARDTHDLDSILLGRFAWGAYLGHRGEAALFYDHRRDDLAGGIYAWRASGFVGSFGATAQAVVTGPWALRGELQVGNAWVGTLGLRYQGGAP
jgi:hypothetical protein